MFKGRALKFAVGDRVQKHTGLCGTVMGYGHWPVDQEMISVSNRGQPYYIVIDDFGIEREWFECCLTEAQDAAA